MRRALVVLFLFIAAGGWLLGWSPYLRIETINVVGAKNVSTQSIVEAAGVMRGEPLARVNAARVERGLTSLPRIKSVSVKRIWPHELTLVVAERIPFARLGDQVVDRQGRAFSLTATETQPKIILQLAKPSEAQIREWVSIYEALPTSLQQEISVVRINSVDDISFDTQNLTITWGSAEESKLKADVLRTLLAQPKASQWKRVDLSAPLAPTTSVK